MRDHHEPDKKMSGKNTQGDIKSFF